MTEVTFPPKLEFLFEPHRYKVTWGGRGAAKSWGKARALLIRGYKKKTRVLCAREFQNSIADSVHQLLSDQIEALGLSSFYRITDNKIEGLNGTKFRFFGLRKQFREIASFEGIDICWVEEAQNTSKASWTKLIPTIRKEGSEIWVSFNPELETDDTYQRFVVNPPANARVVKMSWQDNPWFPDVLNQERLNDRLRDPDTYMHIWEGNCLRELEGAIFAKQLREAEAKLRITQAPYEPGVPVDTCWDLGKSDLTSIWFRQRVGLQTRFINFYENNGEEVDHYAQHIQGTKYVLGHHYLPHDGKARKLGAKYTIQEQLQAIFGADRVHIVPMQRIPDQINAARNMLDNSYFDANLCGDGITHLRHWRYGIDPQTRQRSKTPVHDEHSHAASAFCTAAMSQRGITPVKLDFDALANGGTPRKVKLDMGKLNSSQGWLNG